jgi:hypothetical protein
MPELRSNDEKISTLPENKDQKPKNRKLSSVKDNYIINSSFDEDVFADVTQNGTSNEKQSKKRLVVMPSNNQIKELQTIIWDR